MNLERKDLEERAKKLYPLSEEMQKQWVEKTLILTKTRKHVLFGGKGWSKRW